MLLFPLLKTSLLTTIKICRSECGESIHIHTSDTRRYTEDGCRTLTMFADNLQDANLLTVILTGVSIWNLVEVQVGIITACGPTLRPILTYMLPTESIRSLLGSIPVL